MISQVKAFLIGPFIFQNKINKPLLAIFLLINGIVLVNAILHDPRVAYDAGRHFTYISVLAEFRLPTNADTLEFFSPPLPYLFPALVYRLLDPICILSINNYWDCVHFVSWKFAQLQNVFFSLGLTFYLIKICGIIYPKDISFKVTSLIMVGILPVYYKSFAFVRGEPLLAFVSVLVIYWFLAITFKKTDHSFIDSAILGVLLGLLVLSRQWGFFLFPPVALLAILLIVNKRRNVSFFVKSMMLSFVIAFVVGGWFYLTLQARYGTMTAFNRSGAQTFSFSNQPQDFYIGLGLEHLFSDPVRPSFPNQFIPIFYSELWGDYWCTFLLTRYCSPKLTTYILNNSHTMTRYLARVNLVSLFPTMILLGGLGLGIVYLMRNIHHTSGDEYIVITIFSLFLLIVISSISGYFWFLINYPNPGKGDTIKATYMLQIFPFTAILASEFLRRINQKYIYLYYFFLTLLIIVFIHNLPIMITRHTFFPP